jgi:DNA/RNA-binding domain of Phe-tRNA-synthetase-like protein
MIPISISDEIRAAAPRLVLGCITARVQTGPGSAVLGEEMDALAADIERDGHPGASEAPIQALRELYKALGKDPSRYRGSPEALLRRVRSGKSLYRVLNVVDVINVVSLRTLLPIGLYDVDELRPPVVLRRGAASETYEGIGKGELNLDGLPILSDEAGPFGSPTSDSERTKIRPTTTRLLAVIFGVEGKDSLEPAVASTAQLLTRFAAADELQSFHVE